jgi:chitinase
MACLVTILFRFLLLSFTSAPAPPASPLAVIAYYSGNATDIDRYEVNKLTHIIYCFAQLKGNRLYVSAAAGKVLRKLVSLKQQHRALKVSLAFGGWGGCKACSDTFASGENRKAFAQSVQEVITGYQLDGIDIDWEYPAIQGPAGHPFSPADKQHFTALIKELRAAIGNNKELTVAAGAFTTYLQQSIDWQQVAPYVNRFHLMSFDLVNRNSDTTGHHAALFSNDVQHESADHAIRYLNSLGIRNHQLVIGAACYARIYEQVGSTNNGLHQPGRFKKFAVYKSYQQTFGTQNGFTCYWDDKAEAPWCYNAQQHLFATFDDIRSVQQKTQYAVNKQLYGIMFWELRHDKPRAGLLNAIYEVKMETGLTHISHETTASGRHYVK